MANLREKTEVSQKIPVRENDIKNIVEKLLASLSAKQKLVIASRFGIGNGASQTLESIGKNFNITRERVRQIEADAINLLKKREKDNSFSDLAGCVKEIIKEKGGICSGGDLIKEVFSLYFGKNQTAAEEARMIEIVFSVSGLKRTKANREMIESWTAPDFDKKYFNEVVSELENVFDKSKTVLNQEEILKKMHYSEFAKNHPEMKPEHILNFLGISKKFGKNVFDDWGKARWPLVRPRGVREKATLVLMKQRKPLHFREIGRLIEEYGLSQKKVHSQTVHNELIRDSRFVLVGRGTYALRKWGYEEGTVKDVIVALLKSAGGFLLRENIYSAVLKKRKVKRATIAVNLADKKYFEKAERGYKLK
ncbi:MAG: sigma factor-like helix-turn-helix DNA-binding protein [Patescibacteria group bacterium]|nr:sigma factor-like helix-turn-helix DNA-binding protein [Patescibacteria group bacterium]